MARLVLTLACALLLMPTVPVAAVQEVSGDIQGWGIVQKYVGELPYPTIPRDRWTFEGVIFSRNNDGIRAIRTDVDTSYFVALDSDESFAFDGGFSPDGRWFVLPRGATQYANMISDLVVVGELEIVSTDPARTSYPLDWHYFTYSGVTRDLPEVYWLDNEHFLYQGEVEGGGGIVNPFTGEIQPWAKKMALYTLFHFSPDFTRAVHWDYQGDRVTSVYDVDNDALLASLETETSEFWSFDGWLPDSSGFFATIGYEDVQTGGATNRLVLFDRDGRMPEVVFPTSDSTAVDAVSPDGQTLAFVAENRLFLADIASHRVLDLCFTMKNSRLAWSPDSISLAFTYDGYPVLLNTKTYEMQVLRYPTIEIVGWYPL